MNKKKTEFSKALDIVREEIQKDEGLHQAYKANIAMCFKDEMNRHKRGFFGMDYIANKAAENFLKLWFTVVP